MSDPARLALPHGVRVLGPIESEGGEWTPSIARVLSFEALAFVAALERHFGATRERLLLRRREVLRRIEAGERLGFLPETAALRAAEWRVAPLPRELADRRVEITGPVERKMIVNALNSGASVFMADFEDSLSPTWRNVVEGQVHLYDAVRRQIDFVHAPSGKHYRLAQRTAVLMVRPRGWHLVERHVTVDGRPVSAALLDFGLFFFHNARELVARGGGPYFYIPKLEHHLEARLWNDVFLFAQSALGLPRGTIKATVLIETLPAAFQMDEILLELREHSAGLNCGRWDYIFSFIKQLGHDPRCVLPDRARVGMTEHFLASYCRLLVDTCHRRGAHAMGGMAAQIPIKGDERRNAEALAKVRADKQREVTAGHDGTWVAHPGLVALAREVFDGGMPGPNQIERPRSGVPVTAEDLLRVPRGPITAAGVRQNVSVGIQYLAAWLAGQGCVPLYDLMEDAATAEISRAQLWQWLHHRVRLDDGRPCDRALLESIANEELAAVRAQIGDLAFLAGHFLAARTLFIELVTRDELAMFLTLPAYEQLLDLAEARRTA